MIRTTITGSLPKPAWLAEPRVLYAPWRFDGEIRREAHDDAVSLWLAEQELAGLDIVCDGEQRRRHYIWGFLEGLTGVDTQTLGRKASRGQRYVKQTSVARIVDELTWPGPVLVDALAYVKARTSKPVKVTLPGPMTVADSVLDEYGQRSDADVAMAYADIANREARALAAAGADVIQFDEPCFNIYIDEVADWGIEALERAFDGVAATRAVHICYGYGIDIVRAWKERNTEWPHYFATLPRLAESSVDQVSIEAAAAGVDLACLEPLAGKDVMLGVINVGTDTVETPGEVAERLRRALPYVEPKRLIGCTDCGMVPLPREAARGKLQALAAGARLVNAELEDAVS